MGQYALRAVAELERATTGEMVRRKELYPAPVIRLALMFEAATRLELNPHAALAGLPLAKIVAGDETAKRDFKLVEDVIGFALSTMRDGLGTLASLCNFQPGAFDHGGNVERWTSHLSGATNVSNPRSLETARHVASAALDVWTRIVSDPNADAAVRQQRYQTLSRRTTETLIASAPFGVRAAHNEPAPLQQMGAEFAREAARRPRSTKNSHGDAPILPSDKNEI
jgi:hypothetical protein